MVDYTEWEIAKIGRALSPSEKERFEDAAMAMTGRPVYMPDYTQDIEAEAWLREFLIRDANNVRDSSESFDRDEETIQFLRDNPLGTERQITKHLQSMGHLLEMKNAQHSYLRGMEARGLIKEVGRRDVVNGKKLKEPAIMWAVTESEIQR